MQNLISANDSFMAALEISKPTEALLGSALTWLKTHTHLNNSVISSVTHDHDHGDYLTPVEHERSLVGTCTYVHAFALTFIVLPFALFFLFFIFIYLYSSSFILISSVRFYKHFLSFLQNTQHHITRYNTA